MDPLLLDWMRSTGLSLPTAFPLLAACVAILLLPGALLARRSRLLWSRLGPGERLLPSFLLSAGVLGFTYLVSMAFSPRLSFAIAVWILCILALTIWNLSDLRRKPARMTAVPIPPVPGLNACDRKGSLVLAVIPLLVFGAVLMAIQGGSLGYVHDSLDFVSFVNRILLTDRLDIVSGAFRESPDMGADPRRGAFHLAGAMLCRFSGASGPEMWRTLPVFLVPMALWIFFAAFRRIFRSDAIAFASLIMLMAVLFLTGSRFMNNLAYASRIGWVYSWTGLWALALYTDANRDLDTPPQDRNRRIGTGNLGAPAWILAVACAPILLGIHILSAAQYLISFAAMCWSWALLRNEPIPLRRRFLVMPFLSAAALLPFLVLKLVDSFSVANPLFDHAQGLLYVVGDWPVLGPGHLIAWFGWPGLLGILLSIPLLRGMRSHRDRAFLTASTWIALLIVLNPAAVKIIEAVHGRSLLFRVLLVVPVFQILGWYASWALHRIRRDRSVRRLAPVGILLLLLLVAFTQHTRRAIRVWTQPENRRTALIEPDEHLRVFAFMDSAMTEPAVVLSDPITSYAIPAYTRHYAMTPFHQHSSPADSRTVERIQDAQAVLSAYVPIHETLRLLRKYDVSYVLLNQSFPRYQSHYYTLISSLAYEAQLAKFESNHLLFGLLYNQDGIRLYRFDDSVGRSDPADPDGLLPPGDPARAVSLTAPHDAGVSPDPPNPYIAITPEQAGGRPGEILAEELSIKPFAGEPVGGLELIGIRPDSLHIRPGGVFTGYGYWRRTRDPYVLPVAAFMRFETGYPHPLFGHRWLGRAFRQFYEARHRITYRFGRDLRPLDHVFPAYLWEPGAVYKAPIYIPIPAHAASGKYVVRIRPYEVPFAPNYHLTDLFRLRDSLDGLPVLEVTVGEPWEKLSVRLPERPQERARM